MTEFTALYDACVLYPAPLRDLLMHLAVTGFYRAKWSDDIHEEWIRSLLKRRPDLTRAQLERTRDLMNAHAGDCLVTSYQALIPAISLPDQNDRHVVAAAICSASDVIVTWNTKHFPALELDKYGIDVQNPDEFITRWINRAPVAVCAAARQQRESLKNPPKSVAEFLDVLERVGVVRTVAALRQFSQLL